jgi:hypothetical protein
VVSVLVRGDFSLGGGIKRRRHGPLFKPWSCHAYRRFESGFLQQGVCSEPDFRGRIPSITVGDYSDVAQHLTLAARSRVHLLDNSGNTYRNRTIDALFPSPPISTARACAAIPRARCSVRSVAAPAHTHDAAARERLCDDPPAGAHLLRDIETKVYEAVLVALGQRIEVRN